MLVGPSFAQAAQNPARKPNFLIVLADDLGYGDISPYGGWIHTPGLDRLSSEGLRFTDFHSNSPICSPARAAFLTGRYPERAGVRSALRAVWRDAGMPTEETTIAEALKQAGYRTALFGKWHLGSRLEFRPVQQGFESFRGFLSGNVDYFSHLTQRGIEDWWVQNEPRDEPGYTTQLVTAHALRFIEEHRQEPWFLVLSHAAPHYPYQGPRGQAERRPGGWSFGQEARSWEERKPIYREMVVELDRGIAAVVSKLEELGLQRDTLVFFLSDNGAPLKAPGLLGKCRSARCRLGSNGDFRGGKATIWEGGHRVPALAWWPGRIEPGSTDVTAMAMDLMPTLLTLAGIAPGNGGRLDGVDLSPLLFTGEPLDPRTLFWEYLDVAVRQGRWKLVTRERDQGRDPELYDLAADPGESRNLAADHPERVADMRTAIEAWRRDVAGEELGEAGNAAK